MNIKLFGKTDVGVVRDHNEDNFAICKNLSTKEWSYDKDEKIEVSDLGTVLIVADGMGGTNAGEIASDIAQDSIKKGFNDLVQVPTSENKRVGILKDFIKNAHQKIVDHQLEHLDTSGMGTTVVICWVLDNKLYTAWSGDSRCYVFKKESALEPLTEDHSFVWELVKQGTLNAEEARTHPDSNIITQHLGDPKSPPKPEGKVVELENGDRILVCSDGLNGMLSDADIHYLLLKHKDTATACKELVNLANNKGGYDNITCLLADVISIDSLPNEKNASTGLSDNDEKRRPMSKKTVLLLVVLLIVIIASLVIILKKNNIDVDPKNNPEVVNPKNNPVEPSPKDVIEDSIIDDTLEKKDSLNKIEEYRRTTVYDSTTSAQVGNNESIIVDSSATKKDSIDTVKLDSINTIENGFSSVDEDSMLTDTTKTDNLK